MTVEPNAINRCDRYAWERPGAYEEAPGIFRIPLPLPGDHLHAVNVYAIPNGGTVVLVDAGWALAHSEQLLEQSLESIGYRLRDITDFLVTHVHRDHYTQAVALRRQFGTTVSLGAGEQVALRTARSLTGDPDEAALHAAGAAELYRRTDGWHDPNRSLWEDPDRWLVDGADLPLSSRTLRVISTPGHTRGHVVFHDGGSNTLFAGDHVLPHITPSIGVELPRAQYPRSPLGDYLTSLRIVLTLPDSILLPAHGPVGPSTHARVEQLLAHHEQRLVATAAAIDIGAHTAYETAKTLTWTRHERRLDELDLFNQYLAVHETMAHLQVLTERGWLRREVADRVVLFYRD